MDSIHDNSLSSQGEIPDPNTMPLFDEYIGIDYSGRGQPTQSTSAIQVCLAQGKGSPSLVTNPSSIKNWSRKDLAQWLLDTLSDGNPRIVGIDHAFSFPQSFLDAKRCKNWDDFLSHFQRNWKTDKRSVKEAMKSRNPYSKRELRLTEQWTSSAKSVFQLDGQGTVGKSTHSGLPWLLHLRRELWTKVHFWPFDGFSVRKGRSLVAEVYPSLFRNRYKERLRDVLPGRKLSTDMLDAGSVCLWLQEIDRRDLLGRYLEPPLTRQQRVQVRREGWILGVY